MRRLNIDLEKAVAAVKGENDISAKSRVENLLHVSSNLFTDSRLELAGTPGHESEADVSFGLRAFSLNLSETGSSNLRKKPVPPPRPEKLKNHNTPNLREWPPVPPSATPPPPIAGNEKGKNIDAHGDTIQVVSWTPCEQIPLPPPDPVEITDSDEGRQIEVSLMALEDWRANIVRLEDAELRLLRDIDRHERQIRDLDVEFRRHQRSDSQRDLSLKRESKTPRRLRLGDSYRYSVRTTRLPF